MSDQHKDVQGEHNPGNQSGEREKEGAFGHQSGKDIQQPQTKDVQNNEQNEERKTGSNR